MHFFAEFIKELWFLLREMAPYLIFGFFVAGVLHVLFPSRKIYKLFSGNSIKAAMRASLFGIPLPLCSCGVIPVAAHLKREGAGNGPTLSFLISTPTTGVDSVLATYALLGPLFAVIRPAAAFAAACLAGGLVLLFKGEEEMKSAPSENCSVCAVDPAEAQGFLSKAAEMLRYAFVDLIGDVGKWIVLGIVAGGMISALIPSDIIEGYLGNPLFAYPLMLLISVPLYVCATGSIPIAASLIMKGMTPGAGLVFLIAGPATNTATLSFVAGKMGKKVLAIYLFSIMATSVAFGLGLDYVTNMFSLRGAEHHHSSGFLAEPVKTASACILLGLIIYSKVIEWFKAKKKSGLPDRTFIVTGINCDSCRRKISGALKKIPGVSSVTVDIREKKVIVAGDAEEKEIASAIQCAGYQVETSATEGGRK